MTNWEELCEREALYDTYKKRGLPTVREKIKASEIESKKAAGWGVFKQYKNGDALMEHAKRIGSAFEDEVWMLFYKMGFKTLNLTNKFKLAYSSNDDLTKQIDVVAIDDEVCLLIECKATESLNNSHSWKTDIEAISGIKNGLFSEIRKQYPGRKCKYIFATKNYIIGAQDSNRMKDSQIANFDTDVIRYYSDLVNHLGTAARFQLLGNLFSKQKVSKMETRVPAIQGKMGGLTYYSFSIEPERLLKIAYVLHRTNANRDSMPTYQRLIKKERLAQVRKYINEGGFFPNSLIVSIDTNGTDLKFDRSSNNFSESISKIGVLYLPPTYQSAYIIDGQHRLYGYSDSLYASTNSIPVVAFVNLEKKLQVKMFMDINENQKAVSKTLRNTLNIDLLWDSKNASERRLSLLLYIAQKLGEDSNSPLYGRIITGENTQTTHRCITIEYIKEALSKSSFFNIYKKNNTIDKTGTFEKYGPQDNQKTMDLFYPFLLKCLKLIQDYCSEEWNKGSNGFLTINNCMYAIICIINDIVNIVLQKEKIDVITDWHSLYNKSEKLLLSLIDTILSLDKDSVEKIKKEKGGAAKNKAWRTLQVALNSTTSEFINHDLQTWIDENCTDNNPEAEEYIGLIEKFLVNIVKQSIASKQNWLMLYVPEPQRTSIISKRATEEETRKYKGNATPVDIWDYIDLDVVYHIIAYQNNWSALFQVQLIELGTRQTKTDFLSNIKSLLAYKNRISRREKITKSQLKEIIGVYNCFNTNGTDS